jgi:uncharacterized membrane protein YfcA
MDWTIYWFMFPLAIGVTTTASLCGIGGPAFFTPIFIILFPLLGPEYLLQGAVAAFGAALLTQCFGFTSAFFGYYQRRLIDFKTAIPFAAVGVPLGIIGALLAQAVDDYLLKAGYGILMLVLATVMLRHQGSNRNDTHETNVNSNELQRIVDRDGTVYEYPRPRQGIGAIITGMGALLTGMVSVGIGEVMMPQLIKRHRIPVPVAAGTSVMVAIIVVIACSVTLTVGLIARGGLAAVPWNLVCYTIPGVIIGGQIGPRLQGQFNQASMVKFIGCLFITIGAAMLWVVLA